MDAQAVVVLPRHLFCRNLAGRVSRHVSSGAGAAPDVLVVYHPSRWPNRRDPHTGGKRAVGEGVQTCWPEVRRGCCGLHVVGGEGRGFEQITQGEEFPREKTDAGGITHSSPHSTAYAAGVNAVIGAARGQGCVGATLRARAPRAYEGDEYVCEPGVEPTAGGEVCGVRFKVLAHNARASWRRVLTAPSAAAACAA